MIGREGNAAALAPLAFLQPSLAGVPVLRVGIP